MADDPKSTMMRRPAKGAVSPILGLPIDEDAVAPAWASTLPAAARSGGEPATSGLALSVIVPARNEEQNLPACLRSLLAQEEPGFALGVDWELLVVEDASADGTAALARELLGGRPGTQLLEAPELAMGERERAFTGKTNACWAGASVAAGRWLLFTDADTVHEAGDLGRALHEAARHGVALLSYSPRQLLRGFAQHTLMPLVFSELAAVYPPAEVNDPERRTAAANGQFLLVEREAYFAVGGHRAVGRSVLEDVDLAWNVKRYATRDDAARGRGGSASPRGIRLRYAPDALSTAMYRGFRDMAEGWTKNLALLFPHALQLAAWRLLDLLLLLLPALLWVVPYLQLWQKGALLLLWARTVLRFYTRVSRSNFGFADCTFAMLGLPLFIGLLVRSWINHRWFRRVHWKGREYRVSR